MSNNAAASLQNTGIAGCSKITFFDLDSTLLDCNSASLLFKWEFKNGFISYFDLIVGAYYMTLHRFGINQDADSNEIAVREFVSRTYRGVDERSFLERHAKWFDEHVKHRIRPGAVEALRRHREAGHRLVLCTGAQYAVAKAAGKAFGFRDEDRICTVYGTEGDPPVLNGNIESSAIGDRKADRAVEWCELNNVNIRNSVFYTDSIADLQLLKLVGEPVAVNPDPVLRREAARMGWSIEDWGTSSSNRKPGPTTTSTSHTRLSMPISAAVLLAGLSLYAWLR